jgi:hypothetical protein
VRFLESPAAAPSLVAATDTAVAAASTTPSQQPVPAVEAAQQLRPASVAPRLSPAEQPVLPFDGRYWPRADLAVAPLALAPVVLAYPDDGPALGSYTEVLALYIDETGTVRDMRFEGDVLPPALQRAARDAFGAANFTPGQIDGQAVRAKIRVEVTFESRSSEGRAASSPAP